LLGHAISDELEGCYFVVAACKDIQRKRGNVVEGSQGRVGGQRRWRQQWECLRGVGLQIRG